MSESSKIKIPKKGASQAPKRRSAKRPVVASDDEDAQSPSPKRPRLQRTDFEDDADINVDDFQQPAQASTSKRVKKQGVGKRKPPSFSSDEEPHTDLRDRDLDFDDTGPHEDLDDDDFVIDDAPKPSKQKGSKAKGKGKASKLEDKPILVKDERKATQSAKNARPVNVKLSDISTSPDTVLPPTPVEARPSAVDDPANPPPKKPKFPTIKKNKAPNSTSSGPSTPLVSKPIAKSGHGGPDLPSLSLSGRKPPNAPSDFDLRDPSVYSSLFSSPGGATPRSGVNRREKEARQKELHRMRDEARAQRETEAKSTFSLQGQMEKILRFEEELRNHHSCTVYPNIFASKCVEMWDKEKRKKAEEESGIWASYENGVAREEGEM